MRCLLLFALLLTLPACARKDEEAGATPAPESGPDDKKPEPKKDEPKKGEKVEDFKDATTGITWTEKVTVKVWIASQKEFLNPVPNVWATRVERKDDKGQLVTVFRVRGGPVNTTPTKGTILTDKDGIEYEVTNNGGNTTLCDVKLVKKP